MTLLEIAAIVGSVIAGLTLLYVITKPRRDKPKLVFDVESKTFYPAAENNYFTVIALNIKVHNKGSKSTTIHTSKLTFDYDSKPHEIVDDRTSFDVSPNSTIIFNPSLNKHTKDLVIHGKITNCELMVIHTHGEKMIDLGTIEENKN